jgi:general secretion pathway protein G
MAHLIRSGKNRWLRARLGTDAMSSTSLAEPRPPGTVDSGKRGYTLIEMIIVMAIISILVSIAIPIYQKSLVRTKESLLKNNLFTLRTVIDEYTFDKQKAPQTLQDLVNEGYLRAVPLDPITGRDTWKLVMEDAVTSVSQTEPGIFDVRSLSEAKSLEGTPYSEW